MRALFCTAAFFPILLFKAIEVLKYSHFRWGKMDFHPFKNKNEAIVSLFHYMQQSLVQLLSIHTKPKWLPPSVQDVPNPVKIKHI